MLNGLAGAGAAKLTLREIRHGEPAHGPGQATGKGPGVRLGGGLRAAPGAKVAEAELLPHQIQDLADSMSELVEATAGLDLKMRIQIEIAGKGPVPDEVVARVNGVLVKVAEGLKMK